MTSPVLHIENFAHIADARLEFGDLTVLVGAQGTGKSLALQWLKIALDGKQIVAALRDAGHDAGGDAQVLTDLTFGIGMGSAWTSTSRVRFQGKDVHPSRMNRLGSGVERVFFIPAHRSMLISDGWPAPFQKVSPETPVVARLFSQALFEQFSGRRVHRLFPVDKVLKRQYRKLVDDAIYHRGTVDLEDRQHTRRLMLSHGDAKLPFASWTAGQREFTPLLLGLYRHLPSTRKPKQPGVDWVVIEEPEMGLHPQAITAFMLLVLDLIWRGYRVVLSTHSPFILTVVWALRTAATNDADWKVVADAFGMPRTQDFKRVANAALASTFRTHLMAFDDDHRIRARDISTLDPDDDDPEVAGWGGLTGFSSQFANAVLDAVNTRPEA